MKNDVRSASKALFTFLFLGSEALFTLMCYVLKQTDQHFLCAILFTLFTTGYISNAFMVELEGSDYLPLHFVLWKAFAFIKGICMVIVLTLTFQSGTTIGNCEIERWTYLGQRKFSVLNWLCLVVASCVDNSTHHLLLVSCWLRLGWSFSENNREQSVLTWRQWV